MPLIATAGYAAPDVGSLYLRARELCRQLGGTPEISLVLWGVWTFYLVRAELQTAREIAEEFSRVDKRLPYPQIAMEITLMHTGEFSSAIEHFDKALLLYDPEGHRDDAFRYSQNPGVGTRCHASWTLWFLGEPDQALARSEEALALARELSEPHGLAHAFFFAAILHQLRREHRRAREYAEAAIAVASEHGLVVYQASSTVALGWALIEQGSPEEAIEHIRRGLAAHQARGTELLRPHFSALLAEALDKSRLDEEALRVLEDALQVADRHGERYYQAELYRLKGELLLKKTTARAASAVVGEAAVDFSESPPVFSAEACFNQSIKIAQRQKAKSLELRAAMSLAHLYQKLGKRDEARALVAQIYDRFTEAFDTVDLRAAKALLAELS